MEKSTRRFMTLAVIASLVLSASCSEKEDDSSKEDETPVHVCPSIDVPFVQISTSGSKDVSIVSPETNEWTISAKGSDPYVVTSSFKEDYPETSPVLTFEYKASRDIDFQILYGPASSFSADRSSTVQLKKAESWTQVSFNTKADRDRYEWYAKTGDVMRLDIGDQSGAILNIRDIYFRPMTSSEEEAAKGEGFQYISNENIKLGVDMDHGGSIFYFALQDDGENLVNYSDAGRYIQQSWYGEKDGSTWSDEDWYWNPIQGGGADGTKAPVKKYSFNGNSLDIISTPVHWATGEILSDCEMEEQITLDGYVAKVHYIFRNGSKSHPATDQEMPAIFCDYALDWVLSYRGKYPWDRSHWEDDDWYAWWQPGWPGSTVTNSEEWGAWTKNAKGLGFYVPGASTIKGYRFGSATGATGPKAGNCSYVAPWYNMEIKANAVIEYDLYLTVGKVDDIRERFYDIHDTKPAGIVVK